jgi:hypothetical protein
MAVGIVVGVVILVAVVVPSWRLGKRLGTPPALRNASPEEQAQRKRERAVRRKAEFAAMTTKRPSENSLGAGRSYVKQS